ncbi:hypothetical protein CEXT_468201 [Caerostris extrusa]|uniref:Uncharacterized protein n=1 Tax=Caerostris extrusa TaxID=172846 RepID=A0AAV4YD75_CAEEX|nr:hypothetical protein CEXT_468201 [Caerostris extrusa]
MKNPWDGGHQPRVSMATFYTQLCIYSTSFCLLDGSQFVIRAITEVYVFYFSDDSQFVIRAITEVPSRLLRCVCEFNNRCEYSWEKDSWGFIFLDLSRNRFITLDASFDF